MPSRKAILLFFVLTAVLYGLLLIPWPGVLSGYRAAVAGAGNIFFRRIGDALITFEPMTTPTPDKDIDVTLKNVVGGPTVLMTINARRLYLPTAFTVALILAAPIAWRRKLIALALGLMLISVYAGFGVWLKLISAISDPRFGAVSLGPSTRKAAMILIAILTKSPVTPYIAALLVFVLVSLRREDVVRLGSTVLPTSRGRGNTTTV